MCFSKLEWLRQGLAHPFFKKRWILVDIFILVNSLKHCPRVSTRFYPYSHQMSMRNNLFVYYNCSNPIIILAGLVLKSIHFIIVFAQPSVEKYLVLINSRSCTTMFWKWMDFSGKSEYHVWHLRILRFYLLWVTPGTHSFKLQTQALSRIIQILKIFLKNVT